MAEYELLLNHGTRFNVLSAAWVKQGYGGYFWELEVEIIR